MVSRSKYRQDRGSTGHLRDTGDFVAMVWLLTGLFVAIPPVDGKENASKSGLLAQIEACF